VFPFDEAVKEVTVEVPARSSVELIPCVKPPVPARVVATVR
jgi:hypothetical protein